MVVYRISDCKYVQDLTGRGAALYGGRWNNKDTYILYTAQTRALALLEVVVHVGRMPDAGFCLITIDIPDGSILKHPHTDLPAGWHEHPAPDALKAIGDRFIRSGKYLALEVPSVLMMEEHNYLLNPAHPLFSRVKITSQRSVGIDARLFPNSKP